MKWINARKQNPPEPGTYFVYRIQKDGYYSASPATARIWDGDEWVSEQHVIAWMPIPEIQWSIKGDES